MGRTYAYVIGDKIYLNITNRCPNRCVFFCIRENEQGVGYDLWLDAEPTAEQVLAAAGDVSAFREVVFCGYGEPLLRWEVVKEVARELKVRYDANIRINTNGLAEAVLQRKILPELEGLVDTISISLNAADAEQPRPPLPLGARTGKRLIICCSLPGIVIIYSPGSFFRWCKYLGFDRNQPAKLRRSSGWGSFGSALTKPVNMGPINAKRRDYQRC